MKCKTAAIRALADVVYVPLVWTSSRLTRLQVTSDDPWAVRELPLGLWRIQRAICRVLERIEETA